MMNFLDRVPLDYSRPEVNELRDLFVLAYRRQEAAEQLADSAGLVPGMFPLHSNLRLIWTDLLTVMANQGRLRVLVKKASEDPTASAYQERFRDMLSENPAVQPLEPKRPPGWWKGDDQHVETAKRLYYQRQLEKRNRLLPVRVARLLVQMAPRVARLEMLFEEGRVHGTGFLIQPDVLLTNHHNLFETDHGALKAVVADFDDEDGFPEDHLVIKGRVDTIQGAQQHDWAVIRLERSVDRPPISLGSIYDVGVNDALIIIQHPLGGKKQFALDAMAVRYADENIVQYVADTQKGSSGAPVFNSQMQVVALHHAEAEVIFDVDGRKESVWRNEGIHMNQVMNSLQQANIFFQSSG
jgi:V8-like Glu-specific endopeptidase